MTEGIIQKAFENQIDGYQRFIDNQSKLELSRLSITQIQSVIEMLYRLQQELIAEINKEINHNINYAPITSKYILSKLIGDSE